MEDLLSGWIASPAAIKSDPAQPERLGEYGIQSVLGVGGMATVYLAFSAASFGGRRWCALKLLRSELAANEAHVKMFFSEARIGCEVMHPNVCSVFDYGWAEGKAYLAMEYLRGKSLAEVNRTVARIRDPARHAVRIARILADASEGLCAIHEHRSLSDGPLRMVHRDISPDNLILTFEGFVKIIDLGLAKAAHRGEQTQSGILKGKMSYIAPELLRGGTPDARADIWSLGVVAWELATGKRLFHRSTDVETLQAVMEEEIPPPSAVRPGISKHFDKVVLGALARDPAKRYPSAACFNDRLWEFLVAQRRLVQHRDIAAWLNGLFPGERERLGHLLETVPSHPSRPAHARDEPTPEPGRRSSQRFSLGFGHIAQWRPPERVSLLVAMLAMALIGASGWAWRSLKPLFPSSAHLASAMQVAEPSAAPPATLRDIAQTKVTTSGGFVVEIQRPNLSNDVIVRVRATPTNEAPSSSDNVSGSSQAAVHVAR
ncbi:MAG TPA: serine/threonine-protein kinase [Polyangiaceae bacterium]|nr:serine/threonine-protein kinase [Polyangiaceae bacterium]